MVWGKVAGFDFSRSKEGRVNIVDILTGIELVSPMYRTLLTKVIPDPATNLPFRDPKGNFVSSISVTSGQIELSKDTSDYLLIDEGKKV